jgi:hypothetical protein
MRIALVSLLSAGALAVTLGPVSPAHGGPLGKTPSNRWKVARVLAHHGADDPIPMIVTGRNKWELSYTLVRGNCEPCVQKYKVRERRPGRGWAKPKQLPSVARDFSYAISPKGAAWMTYVHDGRVWVARHNPRGKKIAHVKALGPVVEGAQAPRIAAGPGGRAAVDYGRTWFVDEGNEPWSARPQPEITTEDTILAYTAAGDMLAFWNTGYTATDRQLFAPVADGNLGAVQDIGGWSRTADYLPTKNGGRLVTRPDTTADAGLIVHAQTETPLGIRFDNSREIAPAQDLGSDPTVLVDNAGTLTVAYNGSEGLHGGLWVWQEDRPGSGYLSKPTRVPGTAKRGGHQIVTSPNGTLTVASGARTPTPRPLIVKHLPEGKSAWTRGERIKATKPIRRLITRVGAPRADGDFTVVMADRPGVLSFTYDAPRGR